VPGYEITRRSYVDGGNVGGDVVYSVKTLTRHGKRKGTLANINNGRNIEAKKGGQGRRDDGGEIFEGLPVSSQVHILLRR